MAVPERGVQSYVAATDARGYAWECIEAELFALTAVEGRVLAGVPVEIATIQTLEFHGFHRTSIFFGFY